MSHFIMSMLLGVGLRLRPPVSNTTPFAHQHVGLGVFGVGGLVFEDAEGGRLGRAQVHGQQAAHAQGFDFGQVEDVGGVAGFVAGLGHALGKLHGVELIERGVDEVAGQQHALQQAVEGVDFGGTVAALPTRYTSFSAGALRDFSSVL